MLAYFRAHDSHRGVENLLVEALDVLFVNQFRADLLQLLHVGQVSRQPLLALARGLVRLQQIIVLFLVLPQQCQLVD
jgi:hypothetical protein